MSNALFISEIFKKVGQEVEPKDKALMLKKHESVQLKQYLYMAFCNAVEFIFEPTPAPYKPLDAPAFHGDTTLSREAKRMRYYIKERGKVDPRVAVIKRERMYIRLLETMGKDEAEALEDIRLGRLTEKYGITKAIVERAFADVASWYQKFHREDLPVLNYYI